MAKGCTEFNRCNQCVYYPDKCAKHQCRFYTVVVTNLAGAVTSSVATLTVNGHRHHSATSKYDVITGDSTTMEILATGTAPLSYQWYQNGVAL